MGFPTGASLAEQEAALEAARIAQDAKPRVYVDRAGRVVREPMIDRGRAVAAAVPRHLGAAAHGAGGARAGHPARDQPPVRGRRRARPPAGAAAQALTSVPRPVTFARLENSC
jgi:hypothetical protein